MRTFTNIAELLKRKRVAHPKNYSQAELSHLLGYKNGQFISNVERGLCGIPLKNVLELTRILDISKEELRDAIVKDYEETLDYHYENFKGEEAPKPE